MEAILFDLDGTLIDGTEGIVDSFNVAFDAFGQKRKSEEEVCSLIGHPLDVMFERLGVKKEQIEAYVGAYKEHYRKISRQKTELLPHAKEAVELAHTLAPLGVVTTKTSKYSKDILEHFGIAKYFSSIIGRDDVTHPKPHKEPILKSLQALKVTQSENVCMIGDTCLDVNAAKNAGISHIALLCGYGKKSDLQQCASVILPNSLEAIKHLVCKKA